LPGNVSIEEETIKRIKNCALFAFAYIDIDNFKAYNDVYGYKKGDDVITSVAAIISDVRKTYGSDDDFIGHIGGDDFIVIARPEKIDAICANITKEFDQRVPDFYRQEDRDKGHIVTRDRRGNINTFPLMTISIGVVSNEKRTFDHYAKVAAIAAEMKQFVKTRANKNISSYAKDRRSDAPWSNP
jgi:diguanylate cyclase (GGDEF)-like protein